eukprot:TRINITY_DN2623_c0_g1_i1.p1 TRINITY_DN2623_c0_g1~~TRINITY_DN2623_c0_g1_i1.p1  ORF type:complete len:207 (+),score=29.66 TRINITY_DN2623_c0_g1_i1:306-926(+)
MHISDTMHETNEWMQMKTQNRKFCFLKNFKMKLYEHASEGIPEHITAACGTSVKTIHVLREALRFMKDKILQIVYDAEVDVVNKIQASDVMWVVTVPGMWHESAKNTMRQAAEEAGMGIHNNLLLALEPEAASLAVRAEYKERGQLKEGSKYIIVDCGGGTVDFACHEIHNNCIRETHPACGGPWGSTYIDMEFEKFMVTLFKRCN